jgi:hypothetical protein
MTHADARSREHAAHVVYVYGIVGEGFEAARAPGGVDDAPVRVTSGSRIGAVISALPRSAYGADAIEKNSAEVSWLSPRAMAHDRVLTWAHGHAGVVPLPMFSMWESEQTLARWLDERSDELRALVERVSGADEFGLRVHRRDAAMMESIDDLDDDMARLKKEAQAASPGQRYLLERKLAERGKDAIRAASRSIARDAYEQLRARSRDAVSLPLTPDVDVGGGRAMEGTLVLNAAFLVERAHNEVFRSTVAAIMREHERRGLAFDFTGPWPPYNFVGDARGEPRGNATVR